MSGAIMDISDDFVPGYNTLCCLNCGFEYTHIIETGTMKPVDLDEHHETRPYSFLPQESRGTTVYIIFQCEQCQQCWYLTFGFHKGNVFVESKVIENGEYIDWKVKNGVERT